MGSRKGMRAQEEQARQGRELSGAGAGNREPDSNRRAIEQRRDEAARSAIAADDSQDSDDIQAFDDDGDASDRDEQIDDENDLA